MAGGRKGASEQVASHPRVFLYIALAIARADAGELDRAHDVFFATEADLPGRRAWLNWLKSLADQVTRAAEWNYPTVRWSVMRSANENDHTWYSPVLTHVRRARSKAMQFDVHFQRFANPAGAQAISIPLPDGVERKADGSGVAA